MRGDLCEELLSIVWPICLWSVISVSFLVYMNDLCESKKSSMYGQLDYVYNPSFT